MIRRRQKKGAQTVSHADDWLMTYADMITLLLCFFAVFLSITVAHNKTETKVSEAAPPPVTVAEALSGIPQVVIPQDVEDDVIPPPPVSLAPPPEVAQVQAKTEPAAGDRITHLEIPSGAFFDKGSASLSDAGKNILRDVADELKSDKYEGYRITVEGHTDDSPIATLQFPSNWELSTARASAVVHYFLEQGISPKNLRAAGYADTFPKVANRDEAGNAIPENQAQNRRVVINLEKVEKAGS